MGAIKVGDVVILKRIKKLTVTGLLINDRLEATYWNSAKCEFQTVEGGTGRLFRKSTNKRAF